MANERARLLRRNMTDAERRLWRSLRGKQLEGFRFRRQHPLGSYIVDFICLEKKLVIEVDGGHHGDGCQALHDASRDSWIRSRGYRIIRFWNIDILNNPDDVVLQIYNLLKETSS